MSVRASVIGSAASSVGRFEREAFAKEDEQIHDGGNILRQIAACNNPSSAQLFIWGVWVEGETSVIVPGIDRGRFAASIEIVCGDGLGNAIQNNGCCQLLRPDARSGYGAVRTDLRPSAQQTAQ